MTAAGRAAAAARERLAALDDDQAQLAVELLDKRIWIEMACQEALLWRHNQDPRSHAPGHYAQISAAVTAYYRRVTADMKL